MSNKIFRQTALDRLSSPEQLDHLITVTSPKGWVALLTVGALVLAAILWGIFGTISTKVSGTGMILEVGRMIQVTPSAEGKVVDMYVTPGSIVRPGQLLATLSQPSQMQELDRQRSEMALSQNQIDAAGRLAKMNQQQQQLVWSTQVFAPAGGKVIEVKAAKGDFVSTGTPLFILKAGDSTKLEAVLFVPVEEGKRIHTGLDVNVSPSVVRSDEHGFMVGKVTSVSEYPVTPDRLLQVLGSKELAQKFTTAANNAPIEVRVQLTPDASTPSGYLWTSLSGPPQRILAGTACSASVVVKRQRPIEMVFLQMNHLLRSE